MKDADAGPDDDVATPAQVEALYDATPDHWAIMVLLAAWCQLRRAECLGLQRRDIEWLDDGAAILHVRRQLSANTGDYSSELKSEAGKRSLAVPRLMLDRLKAHLRDMSRQKRKLRWFRRTCAGACRYQTHAGDMSGWTAVTRSRVCLRGSVFMTSGMRGSRSSLRKARRRPNSCAEAAIPTSGSFSATNTRSWRETANSPIG